MVKTRSIQPSSPSKERYPYIAPINRGSCCGCLSNTGPLFRVHVGALDFWKFSYLEDVRRATGSAPRAPGFWCFQEPVRKAKRACQSPVSRGGRPSDARSNVGRGGARPTFLPKNRLEITPDPWEDPKAGALQFWTLIPLWCRYRTLKTQLDDIQIPNPQIRYPIRSDMSHGFLLLSGLVALLYTFPVYGVWPRLIPLQSKGHPMVPYNGS